MLDDPNISLFPWYISLYTINVDTHYPVPGDARNTLSIVRNKIVLTVKVLELRCLESECDKGFTIYI